MRAAITGVLVAVGAAGCAPGAANTPAVTTPAVNTPAVNTQAGPDQALVDQAHTVLARWDTAIADTPDAVLLLVAPPDQQDGDWPNQDGADYKEAVLSGLLLAGPAVSAATRTPEPVAVRWSGTDRQHQVTLISAADAAAGLQQRGNGQSCEGCTPVTLEDPQLRQVVVQTATGAATVPAWSFAAGGTSVRLIELAVAPKWVITLPSLDAAVIGVDGAHQERDGSMTVQFVGAPAAASETCGIDYSADAIESASAVVVIVTAHPNATEAVCDAVGARRTASASLAAPLGQRAVLDPQRGTPVRLE